MRHFHALVLCLALGLALATRGNAQGRRRPAPAGAATATSSGWELSGGVGVAQQFTINDGSTNSVWNFGSSTPLRVSLTKELDQRDGVGVALSGGNVPLSYEGSVSSGCAACDADAKMTQVMATFHHGGGVGFSPLVEVELGAIGFSNFTIHGTTTAIAGARTDWDPAGSIGYGFSFGVSRQTSFQLVEELSTVLHQRTGLSGDQSNFPRMSVTRIGVTWRVE